MATTILILYVSKLNKIIHFPDFDKSIPVKVGTLFGFGVKLLTVFLWQVFKDVFSGEKL